MALATTTLAAAATAIDTTITVASATSVAAGRLIIVDQEQMQVAQSYVSGTTIPVLRGREGTKASAHVITAAVTHGTAADFANAAPQTATTYPTLRPVLVQSVTATSSITLPQAGVDMRLVINATSAATLTIAAPSRDMDGTLLWIVSTTVAQHVLSFTGGLGGVGSGYTTVTAASGAQLSVQVIAAGGFWTPTSAPAWTGTVTKVTAALS